MLLLPHAMELVTMNTSTIGPGNNVAVSNVFHTHSVPFICRYKRALTNPPMALVIAYITIPAVLKDPPVVDVNMYVWGRIVTNNFIVNFF